jgi:2-polyprenyl-3-methyl-5-hydroxy-6-metoxy-1,4-benzoquinol methylase
MEFQNIFDNEVFFEGYKTLRQKPDNANILEEKPAILSLLPSLEGNAVLDLGCGFGENCRLFSDMGAIAVTGIDISQKCLKLPKRKIKRNLSHTSGWVWKTSISWKNRKHLMWLRVLWPSTRKRF